MDFVVFLRRMLDLFWLTFKLFADQLDSFRNGFTKVAVPEQFNLELNSLLQMQVLSENFLMVSPLCWWGFILASLVCGLGFVCLTPAGCFPLVSEVLPKRAQISAQAKIHRPLLLHPRRGPFLVSCPGNGDVSCCWRIAGLWAWHPAD